MTVKERETVLAFLKTNAADEKLDIEGQRARINALGDFFPVPDGVEVQPAAVGGVRGEWVRAKGSHRDAALLYLHGGGYVVGSPKSHRHIAAAIGQASGLPVFVPDYRLAPEHPFPAAVDDAVAVYSALTQSGIAAVRLGIAGDSAGGGLTLATLLALRDKGLAMPACAAVISPWADLGQSGESYRTRKARDPMITWEGLGDMSKAYLGGADAKTPLASPMFGDFKGLPPLLIQVGTEETLYSDATTVRDKADSAGVDVSFEAWGGMIHVWHAFHPLLSEGRDAIARIGAFLKSHIA